MPELMSLWYRRQSPKVGIHVLLYTAEVGKATSGEVLIEDMPNLRGEMLFDRVEQLVQP